MTTPNRARVVCALLIAAGAVFPSRADGKLEPPDLERYHRWGALRARPRIELTDVGYDDNILANTTNEVSDTTATLVPALDGLLLFGSRAFLVFTERVELVGYKEHAEQSFANQKGSARLTVPLGRFGVFGDLSVNRIQERPPDLLEIRPERDEDGLGAGILLRLGGRTEIEVGQFATDYAYSDDDAGSAEHSIADRLDRTERRTHLRADYLVVGRARLTLDAEVRTIEFAEFDPQEGRKDSRGLSLLPGIDFGEGGTLAGAARFGWSEIDAEDGAKSGFSGVVGEAKLALRPLRRTTLQLESWRRPSFSVFGDATYLLERGTAVSFLHYLVWPIGVESRIRLDKLTFPGAATDREDRGLGYDIGVRLRLAQNELGRRVEYSLKLSREEIESNIEGVGRDRTTIGLGAIVGF